MSENGEIYTAGKKFYTAAGSDGRDKSHLCLAPCTLYLVHYTFQPIGPKSFSEMHNRPTSSQCCSSTKNRREEKKNMCSCFQNSSVFPTLPIFRFPQNCLASGLFTNLNILRGNDEFSLLVHLEKLRKCDEALKTL